MSLGSYDFDDFEQVLGFSVSFGFMVGYVKGLAMIYGPLMTKKLAEVQKWIIASWEKFGKVGSGLYSKVSDALVGFVDDWIGKSLDFLKPVSKQISKFITGMNLIGNIATLLHHFSTYILLLQTGKLGQSIERLCILLVLF